MYEASQIDLYGRMRSITYLRELITEALGSDYSDLEYSFNVFEAYSSTGLMETDLFKRLSRNKYTADFSFDVTSIDTDELDSMFIEIYNKILKIIDVPIGEMKLRFGAYDSTDYHHFEIPLAQ